MSTYAFKAKDSHTQNCHLSILLKEKKRKGKIVTTIRG